MRSKATLWSGLTLFVLAQALLGADVNVGTWKLNLAKSTYSPGPPPKAETATFEEIGSAIKLTVDRLDAQSKAVHIEWIGRLDGEEYPVKGDSNSDMRLYRKVNDYTFEQVNKKGGRVTTTVKIVYSRDGRTRINTVSGTNAQGQRVTNVQVYDRQ